MHISFFPVGQDDSVVYRRAALSRELLASQHSTFYVGTLSPDEFLESTAHILKASSSGEIDDRYVQYCRERAGSESD